MQNRINIQELEPQAFKAMYGLEHYLQATQISKTHKELLKIRTSQINGCAFCLDMHTKDALNGGETAQRIFLLNAWRETDLFSGEEKALLAIAEEITLINQHGLSDEAYERATQFFSPNYIAQAIMVVVAINGWNRIAISTQLAVPR